MFLRRWMMLAVPAISIAFAALLPSCGGGSTCEDLCQQQKDANCDNQNPECASQCQASEALNDAADCTSQYDDAISCMTGLDDVCQPDPCVGQALAYLSCLQTYCSANPNDSNCSSFSSQ